jgi:hypothetical protein
MLSSIRVLAVVALLAVPLAAPLQAQERYGGLTPAERAELVGYRLTMDNIGKAVAASARLREMEKDPKFQALRDKEEAKSFSEAITKMNGTPQIRAAIEASGLTSKEFMLTVIELASTRSAVKLQAMGGPAAKAAASLPTSPQNLQFYAAHQADIEKVADQLFNSEKDADN